MIKTLPDAETMRLYGCCLFVLCFIHQTQFNQVGLKSHMVFIVIPNFLFSAMTLQSPDTCAAHLFKITLEDSAPKHKPIYGITL